MADDDKAKRKALRGIRRRGQLAERGKAPSLVITISDSKGKDSKESDKPDEGKQSRPRSTTGMQGSSAGRRGATFDHAAGAMGGMLTSDAGAAAGGGRGGAASGGATSKRTKKQNDRRR